MLAKDTELCVCVPENKKMETSKGAERKKAGLTLGACVFASRLFSQLQEFFPPRGVQRNLVESFQNLRQHFVVRQHILPACCGERVSQAGVYLLR
jgi:hypothetical protein